MWPIIQKLLNDLGSFTTHRILPALTILVAGALIIRLIMTIVNKTLKKSKLEKAAHQLIKSVLRIVLYLLLCLIAASSLGIDVTGVVALASVLTLALSLSLQNFLTNVIGGFTLLSTNPFSSGDYVEIAGQGGTVTEVGMTYTKLTTGDNKTICIPNSAVVSSEIVNYSATGTRRAEILVSASYGSPVDDVLAALLEAADVPTALKDPASFAAVKNYGDHAIEYTLRVWSNTDDYWTTVWAVNKNVKAVFDAKNIEMTYPHLNVHLDK